MLYAIKRIVKTIMSDKEGKLVVREACAHAALVGCPHMIQYFGCWLDDGHLHIQTGAFKFYHIKNVAGFV